MAMSRKDYVAIAEAVSSTITSDLDRYKLVAKLGKIFEADNARFDYLRFSEACK